MYIKNIKYIFKIFKNLYFKLSNMLYPFLIIKCKLQGDRQVNNFKTLHCQFNIYCIHFFPLSPFITLFPWSPFMLQQDWTHGAWILFNVSASYLLLRHFSSHCIVHTIISNKTLSFVVHQPMYGTRSSSFKEIFIEVDCNIYVTILIRK